MFELGSITKTFTALLLAEMVVRGEIDYDDPITARPPARPPAYLPVEARPRRASGAPITLVQLPPTPLGFPVCRPTST